MSFVIREAKSEDVTGIAKVHVDSWRTTYKGIVSDEYLSNLTYESRKKIWDSGVPRGGVYVAVNEKNEVVGFSCGGLERSGDYPSYRGEIYAIYLLEEYQGMGLGKKLVEPIIKDLVGRDVYTMLVLVIAENKARFFYESLGAKEVDQVEVTIGEKLYTEIVYAWDDIRTV